jgi:VCBS repeat-containing protein
MEQEVTTANKKVKRLKRILVVLAALLILALASFLYYLIAQRPITTTISGAASPPRYVKAIYGDFGTLMGIAVNKSGSRIYAVDTSNQKVWVLNKNGNVTGSFGVTDGPGVTGGFQAPLYIAVGKNDEVYVTDRQASRIQVFSPLGKFVKSFTPVTKETDFVWSPLGINTDVKGNIYLADAKRGEHRVMVFAPDGNILRTFGKEGTGNGQFSYPNGIAVDAAGRIYVADTNNARVQVFTSTGKYIRTITGTGAGSLSHPSGLSTATKNQLHVVESFGGLVAVFSPEGVLQYTFGSQGIGNDQMRNPQAVAITPDGYVYVTDMGNNRIQVWRY